MEIKMGDIMINEKDRLSAIKDIKNNPDDDMICCINQKTKITVLSALHKIAEYERVLLELKHQNHHTIEEEMWRINAVLKTKKVNLTEEQIEQKFREKGI